jgi:molybdate transport system substrate-binding protein
MGKAIFMRYIQNSISERENGAGVGGGRGAMTRFVLVAALLLGPAMARAAEGAVTVFAAASLTDALGEIGGAWAAEGHPAPRFSFAASSTLARQIEAGAPAAIFASADEAWMGELARRDLIVAASRRDLLRNRLVLIGPARSAPAGAPAVTVGPATDWAALLGANGRLATGDPAHVPVGIYARQALTSLGAWPALAGRIAAAEDVRGALLLVARGEAPVGIVYATDVAVSPDVAVIGVFPESSHDPIAYPFALVRGQDGPEARAFFAFLAGARARALFAARGFQPE